MCRIKTICYIIIILIAFSAFPALCEEKQQTFNPQEKYIQLLEEQNKELKDKLNTLESEINRLDTISNSQTSAIENMDARYQGYYDAMEDRIGTEYDKISAILTIVGILLTILGIGAPIFTFFSAKSSTRQAKAEFESELYENTKELYSKIKEIDEKNKQVDKHLIKIKELKCEIEQQRDLAKESFAETERYKQQTIISYEEAQTIVTNIKDISNMTEIEKSATSKIESNLKQKNVENFTAEDWYSRGLSLYNKPQYIEAIEAFENALKKNPKMSKAAYAIGYLHSRLGEHVEAIEAYDKAIEINPEFSEAWNNRGTVLDNQGNTDEALKAYNKAIEVNPNNSEAWNNKGTVLGKQGNTEEALEAYNKAIEINPEYSKAWLNKGLLFKNLGNTEEALEAYNKAIELKNYGAMNNKAWLLYELKEPSKLYEALNLVNNALEYEPDNENYIDTKEKILEAIAERDKKKAEEETESSGE